jgi:hypothetical protein
MLAFHISRDSHVTFAEGGHGMHRSSFQGTRMYIQRQPSSRTSIQLATVERDIIVTSREQRPIAGQGHKTSPYAIALRRFILLHGGQNSSVPSRLGAKQWTVYLRCLCYIVVSTGLVKH